MSVIPPQLDADQLLIGTARATGLYLAPIDTPLPADMDTDFAAPWLGLGYVSEDGPTLSTSTDTTDIRGWQALGVLRTLITGRTITIQFQLMQWNALNLALYWDIDVPTIGPQGDFAFDVRSDQAGQRHALAVDVRDGTNEVRFYLPRVQLNAAGDINFQRSSAALLDVTFSVLENEGRMIRIEGKNPAIIGLLQPISAGAQVAAQAQAARRGPGTPAAGAPADE
jgi:hypothetical protein